MIVVGAHLEGEKVSEITSGCFLEVGEHVVGRAHEPQIDILRRSGALEADLEDEAPLQRRGVAKHGDDPSQKAVEHKELSFACEIGSGVCGATEALLQRLLERFGGAVRGPWFRHAASPPKGSSARSTSRRSAFTTRPRRTACRAA